MANFQPGPGGLDLICAHPNGRDVVVIASGDFWMVNPELRSAEKLLPAVDLALEVFNPFGWVLSTLEIALARLGPEGLLWHTRRLSWDGFAELRIVGEELMGLAWSAVDDEWRPFLVDLRTSRSSGGIYFDQDVEGREKLADG